MRASTEIKIGIVAVVFICGIFILTNAVGIQKVEGNEAVVRQHWIKGVVEEVWGDGTHFYAGWFWDTYKYNIGTQKVTFDAKASNSDAEYSRIIVNVGEGGGQEARIAISANYRIGWELKNGSPVFSPEKLVALHKDGIGKSYEDVVVKRTIVDVVNRIARPLEALSIYSGKGFVKFKDDIAEQVKTHPVFKERGIYVENIIVYKVYLNPRYEKEIEAKQLAVQTKLRKVEETKAAEEEARRVFALSQAEVEKVKQIAEANKIKRIKSAEAEKAEQVLMAQGKMESDKLMAKGVRAIGTAEAEVASLKREALYGGESGHLRAQVHIAERQAEKLKGIFAGVIVAPEKALLNISERGQGSPKVAVDF